MRYLIIALRYRERFGDYYELPLGLMYISSVLKGNGHEVSCLNLNHVPGPVEEIVEREVRLRGVDVVCTGGLSVHFHKVKRVLEAARKANPRVVTVVGGGLVTSEPELMVEALGATFGVTREGEITIAELAKALEAAADPSGILGLVHRDPAGKVVVNPERPVIQNLDEIPFPDYEGFDVERYLDSQLPSDNYYLYPFDQPRVLPIISSRGCPYSCTFCYQPLTKTYRQRSFDNFFAEVDLLVKRYRVNMLAIIDELFSVNKAKVREFCDRIRPYNLKWIIQIKVSAIDEEIIQLLKGAGCFYISYGIESASDAVLTAMKKKITVAQVDSALALSSRYGVGIQGNLIFGNPDETLETAAESMEWWKRNLRYHVNLGFISPYPGSPDYEHCLKKGLIVDRLKYIEAGCPPLNMTRMPDAEFSRLARMVNEHQARIRQYGEVLSVARTGYHPVKETPLYRLAVRCPQCKGESRYENFHQKDPILFKLACRRCNQRFDLKASIFEHIQERLQRMAEKRVASPEELAEAFLKWISACPGLKATGNEILQRFFPDASERHGWAVTREAFSAARELLLRRGVIEHLPSPEGNMLRVVRNSFDFVGTLPEVEQPVTARG